MFSTSSTTSSLTTFSTPAGICAGNSLSRESIQRTLHGRLASSGTSARPMWPAPNTAMCACGWPMGSNSSTVAPPQHWPRLAPREKRSRRVSRTRFSNISRAMACALYSRWPPPMVSYRRSRLTTIFEPALRGVEPRSSMMVTSTQGSPCCCSSASALIQTVLLMVLSFVCMGGRLRSVFHPYVCVAPTVDKRSVVHPTSGWCRFCCCRRSGLLLQLAHLLDAPKHALRCRRRVDLRLYLVVSETGHRILDRAPHRDAEHKWRLAHGLGMKHRVLGILAVLYQLDPQIQRHIGHCRHLVAGRAAGHQLALVVPH